MGAQLLARLLAEPDDDVRWDLLVEAVADDPEAALAAGFEGLASPDRAERALGADLVGQAVARRRDAAPGIADALIPRLRVEGDPGVVESMIVALGHVQDPRATPGILDHAMDPDPEIRFAVAFALGLLETDPFALASLRRLAEDPVNEVREWATFALGHSGAMDEATVDALAARAGDGHGDTRAEAIYGLAVRGDPRARALIARERALPFHGPLIDEALQELDELEAIESPG